MKLHVLNTGYFQLDGGAMFGVVPKTIWQKTNPADANNMCNWALRSLLIEDGKRLILVDTGIGDKQSEKFFSHYHLHGSDSLHGNLARLGFHASDITDVILTHLHFDHCGGAIAFDTQKEAYRTVFANATYWSSENHWQWATVPNPREKASFLAGLGSGSACRSIEGELVVWGKHENVVGSSDLLGIKFSEKIDPVFHHYQDSILLDTLPDDLV